MEVVTNFIKLFDEYDFNNPKKARIRDYDVLLENLKQLCNSFKPKIVTKRTRVVKPKSITDEIVLGDGDLEDFDFLDFTERASSRQPREAPTITLEENEEVFFNICLLVNVIVVAVVLFCFVLGGEDG